MSDIIALGFGDLVAAIPPQSLIACGAVKDRAATRGE
jgi:hypothetical protein